MSLCWQDPWVNRLTFIQIIVMKKIFIALMVFGGLTVQAQEVPTDFFKKYMQITTIESVVNGGIGRSKMIITNEDGMQEERDLENLFSLTGLNLKNIRSNESDILKTLKTYSDKGWKVEQVPPLTLSPGDKGAGIFMTRYLLSKTEEKKGF